MTVPSEMLMSYADGELDPIAAKRVERAIETDPDLAKIAADHRTLREQLSASFAPIVEEPVPVRFVEMIRDVTKVVAFERPQVPGLRREGWLGGAAIAASLVIALLANPAWRPAAGGPKASGELAIALNTQIESEQRSDEAYRILVSFRDHGGSVCRAYAGSDRSGIACRENGGWMIRRSAGGTGSKTTDYRQAGSPDADVLSAAQDMAIGDPLDTNAQLKAKSFGWR